MPHILVTGPVDRPETKVFGLSQKDTQSIISFIQPSGGRVGQDGQLFQYPPTQMSHSHCNCEPTPGVSQTLDELDFERGIWYAAQYNDISRVKQLLTRGTCVDAKDNGGYTALHYAARQGHIDLCRLLLKHGADVNSTTRCGKATALHRAASAGHNDVFKLLLDSGANEYVQDADGKTILHRAAEMKHTNLINEILAKFPTLVKIADLKGNLPAITI